MDYSASIQADSGQASQHFPSPQKPRNTLEDRNRSYEVVPWPSRTTSVAWLQLKRTFHAAPLVAVSSKCLLDLDPQLAEVEVKRIVGSIEPASASKRSPHVLRRCVCFISKTKSVVIKPIHVAGQFCPRECPQITRTTRSSDSKANEPTQMITDNLDIKTHVVVVAREVCPHIATCVFR
jgi:hypothetical protein